jgi:putative nucleotidyltransferase with HDIG domain
MDRDMPGTLAKANRKLTDLLSREKYVSTLPHMVLRVNSVANDPKSSSRELSRVIELDPALASRILRSVNSVAYGLQSRITSLHDAISYLGFRRACNLTISASVCKVFKGQHQIGTYNRLGLWRHMVSVAITARMIALRNGQENFEEAFLAGLMHDLGIILEDQYMHDTFSRMMLSYKEGEPLSDAERRWFGFDHAMLGALVAEQWQLPDIVCETIRRHHDVEHGVEGENGGVIACVQLANVLCTLRGPSSIGMRLVKLSPVALKRLGMSHDDIRVLAEDMETELNAHKELFSLTAAT